MEAARQTIEDAVEVTLKGAQDAIKTVARTLAKIEPDQYRPVVQTLRAAHELLSTAMQSVRTLEKK